MIGAHKPTIATDNNVLMVTYHNTIVVKVIDNRYIVLNNGGFYTNTSKRRMNQASLQYNLNYAVYQCNFLWYVSTSVIDKDGNKQDNILEYYNGMVIDSKTGDISKPLIEVN